MGFGLSEGLGLLNPVGVIGTIGSTGGQVLNYVGQKDLAEEQRKAQRESDERNAALQREFAQQGVRWRVADAVAAGLHPLAALGVSTASAVPSYQVGDVGPSKFSLAGSIADSMGQNFSRAVLATSTMDERIETRHRQENMALQNDLLRSQITSINNPNNPPVPVGGSSSFVDGQGDSGMVVNPSSRTASQPGRSAQEAGWRPDVSYSRTDTGLTPVIPQGLSESMEDDLIGKVMWRVRNQLMPNLGRGGKPPMNQLPRGYSDWRWDYSRQEWQPSTSNPSIGSRFKRRMFGQDILGPSRP